MLVKDAMHPQAVTIHPHRSLPDAVVTMRTLDVNRLPVVMDGELVGLLTQAEVVRNLPPLHDGLSPWEFTYRAGMVRVSEVMCRPVLTVLEGSPLEDAVRVMLDRRVGGLPVLNDDGALVGMLTRGDVLQALLGARAEAWGVVDLHMSSPAITVTPDLPVRDAAARLRITKLRVLPVVQDGRLEGVLHEVDLHAALERASSGHGETLLGERFFLEGLRVADLMRHESVGVHGGMSLRDAVVAMRRAGVYGLPVTDDAGRLLGVLTVSDVLRALLGQLKVHPA